MALVEKALVLLMMIMVAAQVSNAAVYKVGDSAGWKVVDKNYYKEWAANKKFKIGDTIIFEYNPQFNNVVRVNHTMYRYCNASAPFATFTTGNDTINITNYGHHFFLSSVPGQCLKGQKVDINVLPKDSASAPTISPSAPTISPPAPTISPSAPVSNTPSPSPNPNNAAPMNVGKGAFGLAMTVFSIFYF